MKIEGKIWKSKTDKFWLIEIPLLDLLTQATSKKEIAETVKDALSLLADDQTFVVDVEFVGSNIYIAAQNFKKLLALILKRQRQKRKLTLHKIASQLDKKSVNQYAQYEQAKHVPSFKKFSQLLETINPELQPFISLVPSRKD